MARLFPPFPDRDDVLTVTAPRNRFEKRIQQWLQAVVDGFNGRPEVLGYERRHGTSAQFTGATTQSVATMAPLASGVYRVGIAATVQSSTIPIVVPSAYTLSVVWTLGGTERTQTFTGALATNGAQGFQTLVRLDAGSVIQFRAVYVLTGAGPSDTVTWDLDVVVEAVR